MKALVLTTLVALSAFASAANAGLMIDATNGPIEVTVDSDR